MREQTANQAPASSSPPSHHPAGSSSITDGRTLDNMLVASPFENTVISPPSTHSMHPTDRRPPLKVPHPSDILKCPRCDSLDTKFCYYNNYSLTQPRYFCKNCKRYWTAGGALRNVPVGGGLRKNKRSKLKLAAEAEAAMGTAQAISFVAAGSTGAGQHHYHGQGALATSATVRPTADSLPNVENRAVGPMGPAVALPSGNIYAQYNSGAPALNYDTSSHERRSNVRASSEHEQAGKISYGGNDHQPELGSFYSGPSGRPQVQAQFYSGCVGSEAEYTGHGHHGFSNVSEDYMVNYNFMEEVANPRNGCEEAVSANYNSGCSKEGGGEMSGHEKDEGGAGDGNNNNSNSYDSWQLLSEGLNIFNGGGSENNADGHGNLFFNMPSSSWPDFSQFNSTSGPG